MSKNVILVGAFHELVELCERCDYRIIGIFDNEMKMPFRNIPILGTDVVAATLFSTLKDVPVIISPDSPLLRKKLSDYYHSLGYTFISLISPKATISTSAIIGEGVVIQDHANISAEVKLGNFARVNTYANIMHDTIIGDFTTVAPNAVILGKVEIGQECYIGSNSTILPQLRIGADVKVGAGAIITKNVQDGLVMVGNPAKELNRNPKRQ